MFVDKLERINKLIEDYMKENKVATDAMAPLEGADYKAPIDEANKKKSKGLRLSLNPSLSSDYLFP